MSEEQSFPSRCDWNFLFVTNITQFRHVLKIKNIKNEHKNISSTLSITKIPPSSSAHWIMLHINSESSTIV